MTFSYEEAWVASEDTSLAVIHCQHLQLVASANGRMHTKDPNLQNVSKEVVVHAPSGQRSVLTPRACFRPSEGCVLVAVDFRQIELRMLAHFTQDEQLLLAFRGGADPFALMAASTHGIEIAAVSGEQREQVKAATYKFIYGCGSATIAKELGMQVDEAKVWLAKWHSSHPGVKRYIKEAYATCRRVGYIETIGGRRRQIESLRSSDSEDVAKGERQALNSIMQGSAADVFKQAMVRVDAALRADNLQDDALSTRSGRLVLAVHDELIFEVEAAGASKLRRIVREAMVGAWPGLRVPLEVTTKQGLSWGELEDVMD